MPKKDRHINGTGVTVNYQGLKLNRIDSRQEQNLNVHLPHEDEQSLAEGLSHKRVLDGRRQGISRLKPSLMESAVTANTAVQQQSTTKCSNSGRVDS